MSTQVMLLLQLGTSHSRSVKTGSIMKSSSINFLHGLGGGGVYSLTSHNTLKEHTLPLSHTNLTHACTHTHTMVTIPLDLLSVQCMVTVTYNLLSQQRWSHIHYPHFQACTRQYTSVSPQNPATVPKRQLPGLRMPQRQDTPPQGPY